MSASLILQDVDSLEYRSYSTVSHAYGTTSDFYSSLFDQDRLGISLENNISLTVAQKQKFTIHEISPEWCYTSEGAKVYVTKIKFFQFLLQCCRHKTFLCLRFKVFELKTSKIFCKLKKLSSGV